MPVHLLQLHEDCAREIDESAANRRSHPLGRSGHVIFPMLETITPRGSLDVMWIWNDFSPSPYGETCPRRRRLCFGLYFVDNSIPVALRMTAMVITVLPSISSSSRARNIVQGVVAGTIKG